MLYPSSPQSSHTCTHKLSRRPANSILSVFCRTVTVAARRRRLSELHAFPRQVTAAPAPASPGGPRDRPEAARVRALRQVVPGHDVTEPSPQARVRRRARRGLPDLRAKVQAQVCPHLARARLQEEARQQCIQRGDATVNSRSRTTMEGQVSWVRPCVGVFGGEANVKAGFIWFGLENDVKNDITIYYITFTPHYNNCFYLSNSYFAVNDVRKRWRHK